MVPQNSFVSVCIVFNKYSINYKSFSSSVTFYWHQKRTYLNLTQGWFIGEDSSCLFSLRKGLLCQVYYQRKITVNYGRFCPSSLKKWRISATKLYMICIHAQHTSIKQSHSGIVNCWNVLPSFQIRSGLNNLLLSFQTQSVFDQILKFASVLLDVL